MHSIHSSSCYANFNNSLSKFNQISKCSVGSNVLLASFAPPVVRSFGLLAVEKSVKKWTRRKEVGEEISEVKNTTREVRRMSEVGAEEVIGDSHGDSNGEAGGRRGRQFLTPTIRVHFFFDCNNSGALFVHVVALDTTAADILEPTYVPHIVHSFFPLL